MFSALPERLYVVGMKVAGTELHPSDGALALLPQGNADDDPIRDLGVGGRADPFRNGATRQFTGGGNLHAAGLLSDPAFFISERCCLRRSTVSMS